MIDRSITSITAYAPATCANLGVGHDILGLLLEDPGNRVTLSLREDEDIVVQANSSLQSGYNESENRVLASMVRRVLDLCRISGGFDIKVEKGIPYKSGMGDCTATIVATLVALNDYLKTPLRREDLLSIATFSEKNLNHSNHPGSLVPCLFGGITLIQSCYPARIIQLPVWENLYLLMLHIENSADMGIDANSRLQNLTASEIIGQTSNLAGVIASLYRKDSDLLQSSLRDLWLEPVRAELIPNFHQIKSAAVREGALGVSVSGQGPTIFAIADNFSKALKIKHAMFKSATNYGHKASSWISKVRNLPTEVVQITRT